MKKYNDFMDKIEVDEKLHQRFKAAAENSPIRRVKVNPIYALAASLVLIIGIASTAVLGGVFNGEPPTVYNDNSSSLDIFVAALRKSGFEVTISQDDANVDKLLDVTGSWIYIGNTGFLAFAFDNAESAALNSTYIDTQNGTMISRLDGTAVNFDYGAIAHWFLKDNLIVLYGSGYTQNDTNSAILKFSQEYFGKPFAGCGADSDSYLCVGCSQGTVAPFDNRFTLIDLEISLTRAGLKFSVELSDVTGPIAELSTSQYDIRINNHAAGFYECETPEKAQELVNWYNRFFSVADFVGTPHVFTRQNAVAVYIGDNAEVLGFLREVFNEKPAKPTAVEPMACAHEIADGSCFLEKCKATPPTDFSEKRIGQIQNSVYEAIAKEFRLASAHTQEWGALNGKTVFTFMYDDEDMVEMRPKIVAFVTDYIKNTESPILQGVPIEVFAFKSSGPAVRLPATSTNVGPINKKSWPELTVSNVTPTGLYFSLINNTTNTFVYGSSYQLYALEGDFWRLMNGSSVWTMQAYYLEGKSQTGSSGRVTWEAVFGELPAGKYLFTKDMSLNNVPAGHEKNSDVACVFVIE